MNYETSGHSDEGKIVPASIAWLLVSNMDKSRDGLTLSEYGQVPLGTLAGKGHMLVLSTVDNRKVLDPGEVDHIKIERLHFRFEA